MRLLGLTFIRNKNMEAIHARTKELKASLAKVTDDAKSYRRTAEAHADEIVALKVKCSRVNVSRMENVLMDIALSGDERAVKLLRELVNEQEQAMSGAKLSNDGGQLHGVLQDTLVSSAATLENGNQEFVPGEEEERVHDAST